jgi:hypothetical protein
MSYFGWLEGRMSVEPYLGEGNWLIGLYLVDDGDFEVEM